MQHDYFGTIDTTDGAVWNGDVSVGGRQVEVDMTGEHTPSPARLDAMAAIAGDVARLDRVAREAMFADLQNDDGTVLYVEHHLAELSPDHLTQTFGTANPAEVPAPLFLAKLVLRHVGLYPDSTSAVFDYTLDGEVTQYLLAITSTPTAPWRASRWRARLRHG